MVTGARSDGPAAPWWRLSAVLGAVVAFGLGIWGFALYPNGPERPLNLVYHTLQLFVLGSDPLQNDSPHNVAVEIARFLAPATTVYAVFATLRALLRDELRRRRIGRSVGHTVVCGDDLASLTLARNLRENGQVVLVRNGATETAQREDIAMVLGDPREVVTLTAAGVSGASTIYACTPQSATNAAVALATGELRRPLRPGRRLAGLRRLGRPSSRLVVYAQVRSDDLVEALRVRQLAGPATAGTTLDFFVFDDIAARLLLNRYPARTLPGEVAIVGFGALAQALLRAIIRRSEDAAGPLSVVVCASITDRITELATQLDAAGRGIRVATCAGVEHIPSTAGRVYVCLEDEDEVLAVALRLARSPDRQVVACLLLGSPFQQALAGTTALGVFGILDAACQGEAIAEDSLIGKAARAVHAHYIETCTARGDTPETNSSLRDWADLPLHLQESNIAQAEHIGVKLKAIGATLVPAAQGDSEFAFRPEEVQRLARLEHKRWMDERRAAGCVYGPNRAGNQHPDLVDWPDLATESKQKDVDVVEHIPELLAVAGLSVRRLPAASTPARAPSPAPGGPGA